MNQIIESQLYLKVIVFLLHRSYNVRSDYASFHQEILFLKSVRQKNCFPLFFIDKCVKKFLDKLFINRKKVKDSSTKKEITISLEFLGKTSLQVKRRVIGIFRTCNKDIKLDVVFKSFVRMSNAFRFKNQIPKCLNSILLYKFTCNTCTIAYIRKTKRYYLVHQFEHLGLSVFTNKALRYSDKDATAICKHCHHQNHVNCTDNFKIMGNFVNNYFLQLKESLLILKLKPSLNFAKESMPLYLFDDGF